MNITDISCTNCNNTTAFEHSHNLVECTSCSTTIHMDTPVFHTYKVEPLHDIMEQRAKEQATKDMLDEWHLQCNENYLGAQLEDYIKCNGYKIWQRANCFTEVDWSTCFDTNNITNNNICDCTAPQVDEDKMCICGLPITMEADWTNDSGYSDVFH